MTSYDEFARAITRGGILTDPWIDGQPRFREEPLVLTPREARAMYAAAEDVAAVYNELCSIVSEHPAFLDDFFGLTGWQKAMWLSSEPLWHGIARCDVFATKDGLAITELNCDTPTGEAEAVVLSSLAAKERPGMIDPNRDLQGRFLAMIEALREERASAVRSGKKTVGLVYPTEFTEDLSVVRLYRQWLESAGYEVVLGSPYNLTYGEGGPRLFDTPFSVMLRHYKTDWWGERASAWDDEDIADTKPLTRALEVVLAAELEQTCAIVNPFAAVVPQNKRSMAFMWEHIHRFSPASQSAIEHYVPVTQRLEKMHEEQLFAEREAWVIKSDYGAEGDEVILGKDVTPEEWRQTVLHARPGRWVAQRYFEAIDVGKGQTINHGIYVVAGEAAGIYARVQAGATDDHATSAPVLVAG